LLALTPLPSHAQKIYTERQIKPVRVTYSRMLY